MSDDGKPRKQEKSQRSSCYLIPSTAQGDYISGRNCIEEGIKASLYRPRCLRVGAVKYVLYHTSTPLRKRFLSYLYLPKKKPALCFTLSRRYFTQAPWTLSDSSPSQRKDETGFQSSALGAHTSSETSSSPRFRERDMRSRRSQWGFSSQPDSQPSLPNSKLPLDSPFTSLLRDPDRIPSSQPASRFSSPLTDQTSGPESYVSPFIKQFRDPRFASRTTLVDSLISQRRDEDGGQNSTFGHPSFEGSSSSPFRDCDLFSRRRQRGFNSQLDSQPSLVSLLSSSFGNLDDTVLRSQRGDEMKPEASVGDQNRILRSQTARFSPPLRDQRTNTASEPQNPTSRSNMGCSIELRGFGPDSQTSSFSSSVTGDPDDILLRHQCGDKIQHEASTFLSRRRDQYRFLSSWPTNILSSRTDQRTNVTSGAESHTSPFSRHYCSPDNQTTPTTPFLSRSRGRDEIESSQLVGSATTTERDRSQDPLRSPSMEPATSKRGGLDDVRPIRTPLPRGNRAGLSSSRPANPSPSLCIERKGHAERYEHCVQQPAGVSHPPGSRWTGELESHHGPLPLEINNELVDALLAARPSDSGAAVWTKEIHPYVTTAMTKTPLTKTPLTESVDRFISTLTDELRAYMMRLNPFAGAFFGSSGTHPSVARALEAVRALIERKRIHSSKPSLSEVKEQIEHFGLYAILSHRWDEGHELSFADVENFWKTTVQAKKGFKKLTGFSNAVSSHYGGRYLWMDTVCISEKKRKKSIPLMFGKRVLLQNSMLATNFQAYKGVRRYDAYVPTESLPDPSISFDEDGVMRIMVSLFPWKDLPYCPSQRTSTSEAPQGPDLVFASLHFLWEESYYGVLLRRVTATKPHATVRDPTNISQEPKGHDKVVYERVSLKVFPTSDIPFHPFVQPEWVYIR
ncbi:hypothetical protein EYR36_010708 [Pleurotus pulmonarius]|nr:hypothetical protein EYR36_010708 [Pleurotus pulmonarius]